ncbi:MAG TPA: radical SAM protein [Chitinispirillaceae bacterium]|nr:radical SAM protein [Chitinispirillaceae bacterium]
MDATFEQWYEENYHRLTGSGVWMRGGEINTLSPSMWEGAELRVLISRLSTSWDVSHSYTHKMLYEIISSINNVYVDMSFLPPPKDGKVFEAEGVPWFLGTSSKRGGSGFDVLAISNSIVQELVNLPIMLSKSGIPLSKTERCEREDVPLVILGGANALFCGTFAGEDSFVDGIFVGESAALIRKLFSTIRDARRDGVKKCAVLEMLGSIDGFYQPERKKTTTKHIESVLSKDNLPTTLPLMYEGDQVGRVQIPISEGCPCFCSFCAEGWSRKPYREYDPDAIEKAALAMKVSLGASEAELYSFNYSMHSRFYEILQRLSRDFSTVKVTSQRFDHIADDPALLQFLHAIGKTSITCGLEGISSRMRRYLHKSIDEKKLRSSLSILIRSPIRELKIFLIATGLENEEDYDEFREFLTMINQMMQSAGRKPRIIFSLTPLVRFPFTPLEYEDAPEPKVLHEIVHQIERLVRCRNLEFRTSAELNEYYLSQILVRAQNQNLLNVFYEVCTKTGYVYYRDVPDEFIVELKATLDQLEISQADLLKGIDRNANTLQPVNIGVDYAFLRYSSEKAAQFNDEGYCLGSYESEGKCLACGACKDDQMRQRVVAQREKTPLSSESFKKQIRDRNASVCNISFLINIEDSCRGIPRQVIGAAIARALMVRQPELVPLYRRFVDAQLETMHGLSWISGSEVITLQLTAGAQQLISGNENLIDLMNEELKGWGKVINVIDDPAQIAGCSFTLVSTFKSDPGEFCRYHQLKHTLLKKSSGNYEYSFVPQSIKKNIVTSLKTIERDGLTTILLEPGSKFDLKQFIALTFKGVDPEMQVRIEINADIRLKG